MDNVLDAIKGGLIVSCQAYMGEPLRDPSTMAQMAKAAELGGACAIRCQGLADISHIREMVDVPVIGLWKDGHEGVYITPTLRHAESCVYAGSDVVAIDATNRPRPGGERLEDIVAGMKDRFPGVLLMADCSSMDDIRRSIDLGFDICSTTLSHPGAAIDCTANDGPDIELLRRACSEFPNYPIVCEGRVHTPADAKAAIDAGAWAVVAGTAITHPTSITSWFVNAIG